MGDSRALVVRGEPGVGKTALLDYMVEQASGCRVARVAGIQSEVELAFAGLHQSVRADAESGPGSPAPSARSAVHSARAEFGTGTGSYSWSGWVSSVCCPRLPGNDPDLRCR